MSTQEEIEAREAQRLSRALSGRTAENRMKTAGNQPGSRMSWAPVQTKVAPTTPVNFTGVKDNSQGGVVTDSPYANVANISYSEEKLRQEQARLKKWGLEIDQQQQQQQQHETVDSSETTPSLESSTPVEEQIRVEERRLSKMGLSSSNLIEDYVSPAPKPAVVDSPVDNTSIVTNIDGVTNEEKVRQEQKRLERWGLKIGGTTTTPTTTTAPVVAAPAHTPAPATSSPFVGSDAKSVATQYGLDLKTVVLPFLDRIVAAAKAVKLVLHKKSTNYDVANAVLLDLVQESTSFALNLTGDLPISHDISQAVGKLAGLVNESIKGEPSIKLYEDIQTTLGLLYLGVTAN
ncbi:hypothetical protein SAMD00019534_037170 [Acytostelium subglobosum LB1]|uniref:hypothetical protein n=1 Tax=Acytostelium subglobosum LB1 TaxID=1410327 RepID=UPI0006450F14|nr:hypothetical protein SAMD00019534_037170 [Acytostelium subglobosum LB1]GAM20542.1 hypothetical protein SAMD00019534_037170 [Acytostelium subglobosum LB1]|eukprot:XP_012760063.1 hypothetical protein SAMD00019534_037170 [Acytostelium subglobosum LB1]